jgi:hypothetical protein
MCRATTARRLDGAFGVCRSRAAIFAEIQRSAFAERRPGETNAATIARFLKDPPGRVLYEEYLRVEGPFQFDDGREYPSMGVTESRHTSAP